VPTAESMNRDHIDGPPTVAYHETVGALLPYDATGPDHPNDRSDHPIGTTTGWHRRTSIE